MGLELKAGWEEESGVTCRGRAREQEGGYRKRREKDGYSRGGRKREEGIKDAGRDEDERVPENKQQRNMNEKYRTIELMEGKKDGSYTHTQTPLFYTETNKTRDTRLQSKTGAVEYMTNVGTYISQVRHQSFPSLPFTSHHFPFLLMQLLLLYPAARLPFINDVLCSFYALPYEPNPSSLRKTDIPLCIQYPFSSVRIPSSLCNHPIPLLTLSISCLCIQQYLSSLCTHHFLPL